jgi:hypothetical protein
VAKGGVISLISVLMTEFASGRAVGTPGQMRLRAHNRVYSARNGRGPLLRITVYISEFN